MLLRVHEDGEADVVAHAEFKLRLMLHEDVEDVLDLEEGRRG